MAQGPPLAAEHHPLWLVSALEEARHVEDQGGCSADMLATLLAVGQSWEVHGYMTFVQEWVDRLAQLLGSTLVDAASRDLGDAGRSWVLYVERSLRKEFLEMVVPDESGACCPGKPGGGRITPATSGRGRYGSGSRAACPLQRPPAVDSSSKTVDGRR